MLIGNIAQQLYNTVDSIVVGRYVGDNALAAHGSASPILNLLLVLFVGISVGANYGFPSHFRGKQREELSGSIGCNITLTAISSVIIMGGGALCGESLCAAAEYAGQHYGLVRPAYLIILFLGHLPGETTTMY